ncbi:cilia- and flagella-associated protein 91-like isoform X2 [Belonocnema kinseyi]|uniref:cilia- and flagella-associated protein 91-like isoform X2 n=1 Tax=Belonocnema kinseyi TaxID=2817044 RepID=UPI00143D5262|nr:cilia- and flagella-associated protein 91-like isoform X2 [Belonocnema kinseyi]
MKRWGSGKNSTELYRHNSGGDVQKCYRRPVMPFLDLGVSKFKLSSHLEQKSVEETLRNAEMQRNMLPSRLEYVQNRGTQTDYRENETQTSPWEPSYKISPGHNPEVLALAHLTWKEGLPVGMHEVEIINRMRIRRAWESILPPMDSETNIKLRASIMTALEADHWSFREAEIDFIMNMRMDLAQKVMENRNYKWDEKRKDRFRKLGSNLSQRRDKEIQNIRQKFGRELRKLSMKHRCKTGKKYKCQDIIKQHADRASELYAPQMRFGENPQRRHEVFLKKFFREDFIDRAEKVDTRPKNLPTIKELKSIKPKAKPEELCTRETRWNDQKLEELYEELKRIRLNVEPVESTHFFERKPKLQNVPSTPLRVGEKNIENVLDQSAVLIQKTVRGRAIQFMMFEGRERCRELIKELRSTHALQHHDKKSLHKEKTKILSLQHEENFRTKQENRLSEILSSLEGKAVSGMLDFLSKELLRLQDERRAHAFALLAERERAKRETAEAGRRQVERHRRRELDEIFRQMVKVNQDSVETYLEDIIKEGIDWVSEKEAKEYVMTLADKIDRVSKYAAANAAELDEEEMVSDMVYNFVLPEVEKEIVRKKIRDKQRGYLGAAHAAIYNEILDLPTGEESELESEFEKTSEKTDEEESIKVSTSETEEILDQGDYKNMIGTVIDQIMSYVIPGENEDLIRDVLNQAISETLETDQAESTNEFSISSDSIFSDSP